MTDKADRQIAAARRLVAHLAQTLDADLSVRLWNGERLPLGARVSDDLGFAINTPQALTRLVRRPRFATLVELLADGGIEIEGGTLLEIAHRRGQMRTKGLFRRLDKLLLARNLAPFAFGSAKESESQAFAGPIETSVEKGRNDKALIGLPLRFVERILRALSRRAHGLHLRLFRNGPRGHRGSSARTSST